MQREIVRNPVEAASWHGDVGSEGAVHGEAEALAAWAEIILARSAKRAVATDVGGGLAHHAVTDGPVPHPGAQGYYTPREFVTRHTWESAGGREPLMVRFQVATAQAGGCHPNDHLAGPRGGIGERADLQGT